MELRSARRTQQERSSETQRKLIQAAIELVHEHGFSRLTITDVALRAGKTSGAIQHHFASRHELVKCVVDAIYPVMNIRLDDIASAGHTPAERIDRLIDAYWRIYSKPEYLVFWELVSGTRDLPEFRDYLQTLQKEIVKGAVTDLTRLFSDINLSSSRGRHLFVFLTCQLRGLAFLSLFEKAPELNTDLALLKKAARHLVLEMPAGLKSH